MDEHESEQDLKNEVGGHTTGGSGEAHTLGHGTSGGDDYTAINPGGTSLSEDDDTVVGDEGNQSEGEGEGKDADAH